MRQCFIFILTVAFLSACSDEEFDPTTTETVIVEAFLYENAPIEGIRISQLIPFIGEESATYEISDAEPIITWNGVDYPLEHDGEAPGDYHYVGEELSINTGESYQIRLEYFGEQILSVTTVPSSPTGLALSVVSMEIAPIESFEDLFNRGELPNLEIYWENPDASYYYVLVENLENNPEEINKLDFDGVRGNFELVTEPTNLDVYNVLPFSLTQYGTYRVVLYHVSQEYVDLYETAEQDSRNLTEPLSNIENGLGIFTSFSSDTIYFEILKP